MPEGDTIHRIANRLAPRLVGKTVERVLTQGIERHLPGNTVTSVVAHGKHLTIELADPAHPARGVSIRAHLGMYGAQRSYTRVEGERILARTSPGRVTLALLTAEHAELWIGARTIEIADRRAPMRGTAVAQLGADILKDDFDCEAAAERAMLSSTPTFGELLLDQRVVAGIGNVYKCEVAFAVGIDPRTPRARVSRDHYRDAFAFARDIMLPNLGPGPRTTRERGPGDKPGDERYFVYGRGGKDCRTCGTPIEVYRLGTPPRWTWSCPSCQPAATAPDAPSADAS